MDNQRNRMSLAPLEKAPLTEEMLQAYAQASGDPNPIHLDKAAAHAAGFPSVLAHGMLLMAFMGDYLERHFPPDQFKIRLFKTRFKKMTFPGDILTVHGSLKTEEDPIGVSLRLTNQKNEITAEGDVELTRMVADAHSAQ